MADAAARRREARKRKLLMSSEDRLNRILQLNTQTKEELVAHSEEADTLKEDNSETSSSGQATFNQSSLDVNLASTEDQETTKTLPPTTSLDVNVTSTESSSVKQDQDVTSTESSSVKQDQDVTSTESSSINQDQDATSTQSSSFNQDEEVTKMFSNKDGDKTLVIDSATSGVQDGHIGDTEGIQESASSNLQYLEEDSLTKNITKSSSPTLIRRTQARTSSEIEESSHESPTLPQDTKASVTKTKTIGSKQQSLSGREIACILVAIVMRVALAYDWLVKYTGQSIMVPFLALQLMLHVLTSNQQKPAESGGMLFRVFSMALMFSNVPPQTVSKLKSIMTVFAAVLADFTMYLFAFITCHCILEIFG
ncbi:uncharacterized protein [Amphiura filiformis]|uniref:uncharacterized protein n=1 Tax=Amphiura filiformis TaxID=82378 RepID=UPI003B212B53